MIYLREAKKVSLFFLILHLSCDQALARQNAKPSPVKEDVAKESVVKEGFIKANSKIAENIDLLAEKLDAYISGSSDSSRENLTSLQFSYYGHKTEYEDFADEVKVNLNLRLPNTEDNWSLIFSAEEDEQFGTLNQKRPGAPPRANRVGLSVGLLKKIGDLDLTFRPGLKIKDPIETSYIFGLKNRITVDRLGFSTKVELFADSKLGTGQALAFNIDYQLANAWVLLWTNEEKYFDHENLFSTLHGPGVIYHVTDFVSYSSSLTGYSTNDPEFHLESYTLAFSRRQEIWNKILFFALSPSWTFEKNNNFKGLAGLSVRFDLIF